MRTLKTSKHLKYEELTEISFLQNTRVVLKVLVFYQFLNLLDHKNLYLPKNKEKQIEQEPILVNLEDEYFGIVFRELKKPIKMLKLKCNNF